MSRMDIGDITGEKRSFPDAHLNPFVERDPPEPYIPHSDLPDPNTMNDPELNANEQRWAQQPFAGPFSPAMYGAMKRGVRPRSSYIPYEKYGKRRVARYPRKRAYAKRKYTPKYGKKGSRFYYSRYNPKSYYVRGSRANIKRFGSTWRKGTKTQRLARKRVGYYGRGKYGVFGANAASGYMGRGMYSRMKRGNQLISGGVANTPVMQSSGYDGSLIVSHRELVQEVYGAGPVPTGAGPHPPSGFEVQTLTVNPGLERVFPWMSQLAANFEEYEIIQCVFEYEGKKMVGTTDELTIHGTVTAAHKFNFKSQEFQDKHEMQSYPHANQCQAHQSLAHGVEADPGKIVGDGHKFVRLGGLLATDDQRDFDHATFSLAQSNIPAELASKEIGCLYVSYTVKLMKPKLHANRGLAIKSFRAVSSPNVSISQTTAPTILGTTYDERADGSTAVLAPHAKNTLDVQVKQGQLSSTVASNYFCFPVNASGVYKITVAVEGTSLNNGTIANISYGGSGNISDYLYLQGEISTTSTPMLYAGGDITTLSPDDVRWTGNTGADLNSSKRVTFECVIKVRPQVGNVINCFAVKNLVDSGTIAQSSLDVTEYNTFGESVPTIGR